MALTQVRSAALDLAVGLDGDQISVVLADLRLARLGRRLGTPAVNVAHPVGGVCQGFRTVDVFSGGQATTGRVVGVVCSVHALAGVR